MSFNGLICHPYILLDKVPKSFAHLKTELFLFWKILFIFRERGKEGEREGEKHRCVVASCMPPVGDLAHNPGRCPDWESNGRPFGSQAHVQSTEPHQPGELFSYCGYLRVLYNLDKSCVLEIRFANIFSQFVACLFMLLMSSAEQKVFILKSSLLISSLLIMFLVSWILSLCRLLIQWIALTNSQHWTSLAFTG